MTSLRSVSAAAILIPAGLAAFTLIPAPSHHSAAVSSPAPVAEPPRPRDRASHPPRRPHRCCRVCGPPSPTRRPLPLHR